MLGTSWRLVSRRVCIIKIKMLQDKNFSRYIKWDPTFHFFSPFLFILTISFSVLVLLLPLPISLLHSLFVRTKITVSLILSSSFCTYFLVPFSSLGFHVLYVSYPHFSDMCQQREVILAFNFDMGGLEHIGV